MAQKRSWDGFASCSGCDARWGGHRACHCAACHQTFGGLTMFDAHRIGGCKAPRDVGATRLVNGIWRGPEYTPEIASGGDAA